MIVTHKIQCFPNKTQKITIARTLGACRWIHNQYLGYNKEIYETEKRFVSGYEYSKMITKLKKEDEKFSWLNEISQKAVKEAVLDADKSFKRFFNGKSGFPRFKAKKDIVESYYLYPVKGEVKHNKIKLPVLGWMRIRENNYVPSEHILHARMVRNKAGQYYITLTFEDGKNPNDKEALSSAMGIDVGIKNYLSIARASGKNMTVESFINNDYLKKLEKRKLKLEQVLSYKAETNYGKLLNMYLNEHHEEPSEDEKKKLKGESYRTENIYKVRKKINRVNKKMTDYKENFINKLVSNLVKAKPEYITVETLSVTNMISRANENHKTELSKHIQDSQFRFFFTRLTQKCMQESVELRAADKYFASSKLCSCCGNKKHDLTLSDRVYVCTECGLKLDRDLNAAINLLYTNNYTVIV